MSKIPTKLKLKFSQTGECRRCPPSLSYPNLQSLATKYWGEQQSPYCFQYQDEIKDFITVDCFADYMEALNTAKEMGLSMLTLICYKNHNELISVLQQSKELYKLNVYEEEEEEKQEFHDNEENDINDIAFDIFELFDTNTITKEKPIKETSKAYDEKNKEDVSFLFDDLFDGDEQIFQKGKANPSSKSKFVKAFDDHWAHKQCHQQSSLNNKSNNNIVLKEDEQEDEKKTLEKIDEEDIKEEPNDKIMKKTYETKETEPSPFIPSMSFRGQRHGYEFKTDKFGTGYYKILKNNRSIPDQEKEKLQEDEDIVNKDVISKPDDSIKHDDEAEVMDSVIMNSWMEGYSGWKDEDYYDYLPSPNFIGKKDGYEFKTNDLGTGYYRSTVKTKETKKEAVNMITDQVQKMMNHNEFKMTEKKNQKKNLKNQKKKFINGSNKNSFQKKNNKNNHSTSSTISQQTKTTPVQFEREQNELISMGFGEKETNLMLLIAYGGRIDKVVDHLISS
mmetsp:Transcript_13266/g.17195  ORF Transcript_13266/g.17195 Transcript_13266/m.17195 type:complete len:504 (+) Transcript_13266:67-1578(+)